MSPYRTAEYRPDVYEIEPRAIFEGGKQAVEHINKGCPNGLVLEPKTIIEIDLGFREKTRITLPGKHVVKHGIRTMIRLPRHWTEVCCREEIVNFLNAERLKGWYGLRWKLYKNRHLNIQMFQGVVNKEDLSKLIEEIRGCDELVQDGTRRVRWKRNRLHERARRALQRFGWNRRRTKGPGKARLDLPGRQGPLSDMRDP